VDTTGAGDTFTGAYATEYLKQKGTDKWDIKSTILRANKACAMTILKVGCQDGIPWSDEIDQFPAELNTEVLKPENGENNAEETEHLESAKEVAVEA